MQNQIRLIEIDKLRPHPDNPNKMSKTVFNKLVRNIERTGVYEPLVVRADPKENGCYQIINGHHRCMALKQLGYEQVQAVVWDVDDEQVDILLMTLNRLGGSDMLDKKVRLFERLKKTMAVGELCRYIPETKTQIEKLSSFQQSLSAMKIGKADCANAVVFFLSDEQKQIVDSAMKIAEQNCSGTRAAVRAEAVTKMAKVFIDSSKVD